MVEESAAAMVWLVSLVWRGRCINSYVLFVVVCLLLFLGSYTESLL